MGSGGEEEFVEVEGFAVGEGHGFFGRVQGGGFGTQVKLDRPLGVEVPGFEE